MKQFEKFKEAFKEKYESIWDFMDTTENGTTNKLPFGGELEENLDQTLYDSIGNENSDLRRIFFFKDFNIFVEFYGTRQSYNGEDWNGFKQVKPAKKQIDYYEEV